MAADACDRRMRLVDDRCCDSRGYVRGNMGRLRRTEELSGRKDPGKVVVDEVAGQLICSVSVDTLRAWSTVAVIVSFILFRFFDIVKPYPANRLQDLDGGMGIMFDDLVAGVYGAVIVSNHLENFLGANSWSVKSRLAKTPPAKRR